MFASLTLRTFNYNAFTFFVAVETFEAYLVCLKQFILLINAQPQEVPAFFSCVSYTWFLVNATVGLLCRIRTASVILDCFICLDL